MSLLNMSTLVTFSESFHIFLKFKLGHGPTVIEDEELQLLLFEWEFPNSVLFDYPWEERRILWEKWSSAAWHWNIRNKMTMKNKTKSAVMYKEKLCLCPLLFMFPPLSPRYVKRPFFSHHCDKFTSKHFQLASTDDFYQHNQAIFLHVCHWG